METINNAADYILDVKSEYALLLSKVNFFQNMMISALKMHKYVLFGGAVGSGKTRILIKKCIEQALQGKKVLYSCGGSTAKILVSEYIKKHIPSEFFDKIKVASIFEIYDELFEKDDSGESYNAIKPRPGVTAPEFGFIAFDGGSALTDKCSIFIKEQLIRPETSLWINCETKQSVGNRLADEEFLKDIQDCRNVLPEDSEIFTFNIEHNVRSTLAITDYIFSQTGIKLKTFGNTPKGVDVIRKGFRQFDVQNGNVLAYISDIVVDLTKQGISPSDILIVSDIFENRKRDSGVLKNPLPETNYKTPELIPINGIKVISSNHAMEDKTVIKQMHCNYIRGIDSDIVINLSYKYDYKDEEKYRLNRFSSLSCAKYLLYDIEIS